MLPINLFSQCLIQSTVSANFAMYGQCLSSDACGSLNGKPDGHCASGTNVVAVVVVVVAAVGVRCLIGISKKCVQLSEKLANL
jgi:hypothetical protein